MLITFGLLMMLSHARARRRFERLCSTAPQMLANVRDLLGFTPEQLTRLCCHNTVDRYLRTLPSEFLQEALTLVVRGLIRSKFLDDFRFFGSFRLAIDGTEIFRYKRRHCPHCLTAEHADGRIDYFHQIVTAKIITAGGLSFPVAFEMIDNSEPGNFDKQDCETKAGLRLMKRVRELFPRTPFHLLGDALYACEPILQLCTDYNWSFSLTFKKGRTPKLWAEAQRQFELQSSQCRTGRCVVNGKTVSRVYAWIHNLDHKGSTCHVVRLEETKDKKTTTFVYLTDLRPDRDNVIDLVNKGGRQRQKLETSHDIQKHHGYELDHDYGSQGHALANYIQLIQIAHLINQIICRTNLLAKLAADRHCPCPAVLYESVRDFIAELAISLYRNAFSPAATRQDFNLSWDCA